MTRVLIVDDKDENLYYLRALLEGNGYTVEAARHGAEALIKARQVPPDLVISDLLMPVMDGYTLLRHWKAESRLMDIPFIVYTATYTEEEDEKLALDLGADAFILKPSEPDDFIARLRDVRANPVTTPFVSKQPASDETGMLKQYSETLIRKLEGKTLQLEEANRALKLELAERRSVEEELDFKNRLLQTQLETSLDAIMVVGENTEVLTFNRKFIELWGLTPQIMGTHVDAIVLPFAAGQSENPEAFITKVKYLYTHRGERSQDEIRLKDGRIIDRFSSPIVDTSGNFYGRVWYFRDITERRRAQESLQKREREQRQLAQLLDTERSRLIAAQRVAKLGSWETNLVTLEVIWSDQTYRIFETDLDSFQPTHQHFIELVHPEDRAAVNAAFEQSSDQDVPCAIEHRILLPDGRIKFVEENWQVYFDDLGKPVRALGTCQDITERKTSEAALKASELRYHSLFENMLEGYAYCETIFEQDVLTDFVYLEVNLAFGRLTGLNEVVGRKITDVIPGVRKENAELFEIYGRVALTGQPEKFETYMPALGAWLSTTVYSSDRGHFVAVFENITERKESEARIRHLNRVHAVLSGINTLIVHENDRDELLREACRIAVEEGGFRMALLCTIDKGTSRIVPCASAGKGEELMAAVENILSSSEDAEKTMVARAIREKRAIVSNDSQNDPQAVLGRQYAEAGVNSMVVIPLISTDETLGVLSLYASEIEFFHQEELKLLSELADDVAYAINHIEKQERLNYLAYYDPLTGLANHSLFSERVEQFIQGARDGGHKLALLLIDIERFKNINDSLGRSSGDLLLKQVAEWLKQRLGREDLLARLEGDHLPW